MVRKSLPALVATLVLFASAAFAAVTRGPAFLVAPFTVNSTTFATAVQLSYTQVNSACGTDPLFGLPIANTTVLQARVKKAAGAVPALSFKLLVGTTNVAISSTTTTDDGTLVLQGSFSQSKGSKTVKLQMAEQDAANPDATFDPSADVVSLQATTSCN